jgi:hypothetical protein
MPCAFVHSRTSVGSSDRPGNLFKLITAAGFAGAAIIVSARRGLARESDASMGSGPTLSHAEVLDRVDPYLMPGVYEHFIYGPTRQVLDAVAGDLAQADYLVPTAPFVSIVCAQDSCPGCGAHWRLKAYGSVSRVRLPGGRDDVELACITHGATCDGGGCLIV